MNRRRFFTALVVVSPLTVFGSSNAKPNWQPDKLSHVQLNGSQPVHRIEASDRYIVLTNYVATGDVIFEERTLFDLETGKARFLSDHQGVADQGAWLWELQTDKSQPQLLLRQGDQPPMIYDLNEDARHATRSSVTLLRVRPALNRVELLLGRRIYLWNRTSRQLERTAKIAFSNGDYTTLSSNGENIVHADLKSINIGSSSNGRLVKRVPFIGFVWGKSPLLTPPGNFILYLGSAAAWPATNWRVVKTSSGRVLWNIHRDSYEPPVLSPDEKEVALPLNRRSIWQIHSLPTGKILRALPLVSGATIGAFSPDGATLYSVANGVLYRQRAR